MAWNLSSVQHIKGNVGQDVLFPVEVHEKVVFVYRPGVNLADFSRPAYQFDVTLVANLKLAFISPRLG